MIDETDLDKVLGKNSQMAIQLTIQRKQNRNQSINIFPLF